MRELHASDPLDPTIAADTSSPPVRIPRPLGGLLSLAACVGILLVGGGSLVLFADARQLPPPTPRAYIRIYVPTPKAHG
jgi:hypothetical protein